MFSLIDAMYGGDGSEPPVEKDRGWVVAMKDVLDERLEKKFASKSRALDFYTEVWLGISRTEQAVKASGGALPGLETTETAGFKRPQLADMAASGAQAGHQARLKLRKAINLRKVAGKWVFRTAEDLSYLLEKRSVEERRLSKAAMETLAIIAYHQPVTRAEIEEIRGVAASAGTLDVLMEIGWIRPRGRRRAPGRPITYGTTEQFLDHFGLDAIKDLPGLATGERRTCIALTEPDAGSDVAAMRSRGVDVSDAIVGSSSGPVLRRERR